MRRRRLLRPFILCLVVLAAGPVLAQKFRFEIDPDNTYTRGRLELRIATEGLLFGAYDARENPQGSRLSATLDQDVLDGANEDIQAAADFLFSTTTPVRSSGSFTLEIDTANGLASVSDYEVERVTDPPLSLGSRCRLVSKPFRSAAPDALFDTVMPELELPATELYSLKVMQRPGPRSGSLSTTDDGFVRVSVTFMADVEIDFPAWRQKTPVRFPMAMSLVGNLLPNGDTAEFGYPLAQGGDNLTRDINVRLQDIALKLPRKDADPVPVRYEPTIKRIELRINGMRQFRAVGKKISDSRPTMPPDFR